MIYVFTMTNGNTLSAETGTALPVDPATTKLAENVAVGDKIFTRTLGCSQEVASIATA